MIAPASRATLDRDQKQAGLGMRSYGHCFEPHFWIRYETGEPAQAWIPARRVAVCVALAMGNTRRIGMGTASHGFHVPDSLHKACLRYHFVRYRDGTVAHRTYRCGRIRHGFRAGRPVERDQQIATDVWWKTPVPGGVAPIPNTDPRLVKRRISPQTQSE